MPKHQAPNPNQGDPMGDKSPKAKDKKSKQDQANKSQKKAAAVAKAPQATPKKTG